MNTNKLFLCLNLLLMAMSLTAQSGNSWLVQRKPVKSILENVGQFNSRNTALSNEKIIYGFDGNHEDVYFSANSVLIELTNQEKRKKSDEEKKLRAEKKKVGFKDADEFRSFEEVGHTMKIEKDEVLIQWLGANPNPQLVVSEEDAHHHSYTFYEGNELVNKNFIKSWKKLTYKNLYPKVDVVYEIHSESGIKYSIILHPGADVSNIKLKYSKNIKLNENGSISVNTMFGEITDHAPVSFYDNNQNAIIPSFFVLDGNTIKFNIPNYDRTKTLIIDPWTQMPNFANTNWDCVWECEKDGAGNVYIIGGTSPLQLLKYNSTGTLQWTYNTSYDTTEWLGTFATDDAGNSYISNGSPARIMKVNTSATQVWSNNNPGGLLALTEFWNITFNCDQTKLVVAGTDGGAFSGPQPYIFDIDMNTGNVLTSLKIHEGGLANPQEIRSITPCNNGRYYFLSHDSIGWVHQSLTACTQNGGVFRVNNGINLGYKCEDWRYTNSGIMALAHYNGFVFVHRGNQLQKRDFNTAAVVATVSIPGGSFVNTFGGNNVGCSGIDIDNCGNIYVGSTNGVYKFDQNLNQLTSFPTTFVVYDVEVSTAGDIIAGGSTGNANSGNRTGYIQSFAATACPPQAIVCCDVSICDDAILCVNDAPINVQVATSGGTFSATCGACINSTTGVFNPTTAGVGSHTITYSKACGSESIVITVNSCAPITVCQLPNGALSVSGGSGPYNWSSFNPGGTITINNQADCQACGYSWTFGFCLNGTFPATSCTIQPSWTSIGTGTTITAPSTYPIRVSNGSGSSITITTASSIAPCSSCPTLTVSNITQTNVSCNGLSNGTFSFNTNGGSGPYNYALLNGPSTVRTLSNVSGIQTLSNLPAGTYTLNVVDNNSCGGTLTITISQPTVLNVNIDSTFNANCLGTNGRIFTTPTGGTSGYTYQWSNGANTQDISSLNAGTYRLTVTDANGCALSTQFVTITAAAGISVTVDSVRSASCRNNDGRIGISVSGASQPYSYLWSNNGTTQDISGLSAGSYSVTVTDVSGCTFANPAQIITAAPGINLTVDSVRAASCASPDGRIGISVNGGTGPYNYQWSNNATTQDISGLNAGTFLVTVTDASGCTTISSALNVSSASGLTLNVDSIRAVTCLGGTDGFIQISILGGTPGFNYSWSNGQTTQNISGLTAGSYGVTITDIAGCQINNSIITVAPGISNSADIIPVTALCQNTTAFNLTVTGTQGGTWTGTGVNSGGTFNPNQAGVFEIIYSVGGSCPVADTINITVLANDNANINVQNFCLNQAPFTLTVNGTQGGSWTGTGISSNGTFDPSVSGVGSFDIVYTTNSQCPVSDTATINVTANAVANIQADTFCQNSVSEILVNNGTGGGIWSGNGIINPNTGTFNPSQVGLGLQTVIYTISGACAASDTAVFLVAPNEAADIVEVTFCLNQGISSLTVNGTQGGSWSGNGIVNTGNGSFEPSVAGAGTHPVIYITGGLCPDSDTANIIVLPNSFANITEDSFCLYDNATNLTLAGLTGGVWSGPGITDSVLGTFDPIVSGSGQHLIYYRTSGNCAVADSAIIVVDFNVDINAGVLPTLASDTTVTWGNPFSLEGINNQSSQGVSYNWTVSGPSLANLSSATSFTITAQPDDDGVYIFLLTATSRQGCIDTSSVVVNVVAEVSNPVIPTAFSPNADNNNDIFQVVDLNRRWIKEFKIYNRWGQLIYDNINEAAWNGKFKGADQPRDVYMYIISWQFLNDVNPTVKRGHVTLMR